MKGDVQNRKIICETYCIVDDKAWNVQNEKNDMKNIALLTIGLFQHHLIYKPWMYNNQTIFNYNHTTLSFCGFSWQST